MIIVDIETTGTDPKKNCIVSIGALDFDNPAHQFYEECCIYEESCINQKALEVNGFTEAQVRDKTKKSVREVLRLFIHWLTTVKDKTIAGENPSFDRDFLNAASAKEGLNLQIGYRTIDLHTLCYAHHLTRGLLPPLKEGRTDINADTALRYVGLPDEPKPHHAFTGTKMEAEAFSRLIYGKTLLQEFEQFDVPEYVRKREKE